VLTALFLMLAAFFLGCIATEIGWIGKMRRLRSLMEEEKMAAAAAAVSKLATGAGARAFRPEVGTAEGLLGLQQQLSEKTEASPVHQSSSEILKS
jgi:hypothetical protein